MASLRGVIKGRVMRGRRPQASHRVVTPIGWVLTLQERVLASRRREISDQYMSDVCSKLGEIHLSCVPRPPASDRKALAQYNMLALLAVMNSKLKAAVLVGVKDSIVRAKRYRFVCDKITREILDGSDLISIWPISFGQECTLSVFQLRSLCLRVHLQHLPTHVLQYVFAEFVILIFFAAAARRQQRTLKSRLPIFSSREWRMKSRKPGPGPNLEKRKMKTLACRALVSLVWIEDNL